MSQQEPVSDLPEILMPEEAATVITPDGDHRMLFLRVPQLVPMLKEILEQRPGEVTYRWAFHPGHRIYVMFVVWSSGHQAGIAIPEGVGDQVIDFLTLGPCDVLLTEAEVQQTLAERASQETIERIVYGVTVPIPGVTFQRQA